MVDKQHGQNWKKGFGFFSSGLGWVGWGKLDSQVMIGTGLLSCHCIM